MERREKALLIAALFIAKNGIFPYTKKGVVKQAVNYAPEMG
ncbi:MAG: hypothetical protein SPE91_02725 [Megasphaera elsdenii]|nr:hypothetical protein [Megasphaera elsdenii]